MNGDEMSRGMNQQNRRSNSPNKFNEKPSYSPSSNYSSNHNSNHNYKYAGGYNSGNSSGYNGSQVQNQRRRPQENRFKTGGGHHSNSNDRLVKQNDIIIRLLKEIRDRLPAPPQSDNANITELEYLEQDFNASSDGTDQNSDVDTNDDIRDNDIEEMDTADDHDVCEDQEFIPEQERN